MPQRRPTALLVYSILLALSAGCPMGPAGINSTTNTTPTADAGPDQNAQLGDRVVLNGGMSTDPDGDLLFFAWEQIVGPGVALNDPNAETLEFVAVEEGLYEFMLTVSDGRGGFDSDTVRVFVGTATPAGTPQADAGPDRTVNEGDVVTLRGANSSNPGGAAFLFLWEQLSGPSVALSDPTSAEPTFDAPQVDADVTLTFLLTISNGDGLEDSDSVTITVLDEEAPSDAACLEDGDCDNDDPCTIDECDRGECVSTPLDCPDGEECSKGECVPVSECAQDEDCPGGRECVDGACVPSGCQSNADCNDGDSCTVDTCVNGQCASQQMVCIVGENCVNGNCVPTDDLDVSISGCPDSLQANGVVTLSATAVNGVGDVTFEWTATSGTFDDASSPSPTFTAEAADAVVTVTATDSAPESTAQDACTIDVTIPVLFVANSVGNNVTSYSFVATLDGNVAPDTNLTGGLTGLDQSADVAVTSGGLLMAINVAGNSLNFYSNATAADGDTAPERVVQGESTGFGAPATVAYDPTNDLVFVANILGNSDILVFTGASDAGLNGNVAPTRTIMSSALSAPFGINLDAEGNLYVANNGKTNVLVFADAAAADGDVSPSRTITADTFVNLFDVFVDGNDTLYVVDTADDEILVFRNASTLNGPQTPDATIAIPNAASLAAIVVDANDTGYVSDSARNAVYSFDNIRTLNGMVDPDRTIQGVSTQLNNPVGLFLFFAQE